MSDKQQEGVAPTTGVETKETVKAVVYPYTESKIVKVLRKNLKPILPEIGVVGESARDYLLAIGSSFAGPNSGVLLGRTIFTAEEERMYMPGVVGVQPSHQEWDNILNEYWKNLYVKVPYDGLSLEVGFTYYSETDKKPISLDNFVLYKYCLKYSQVANSIDDINMSNKIRFYLMESTYVQSSKLKAKELRDRVFKLRLEMEQDIEKMKSLIILTGNPVSDKLEDLQLMLATIAENDPAKFLELARDKQLMERAFVERLIRNGICSRPLNSTLVMYDGTVIGNNLTEAAGWLKIPANSEIYLSMKQQLDQRETK